MSHPAHSFLSLEAPRVCVAHFSRSHPRTSCIRYNKNIGGQDAHWSSSLCRDSRPRGTAAAAFQPTEMSLTQNGVGGAETWAIAHLRGEEMHRDAYDVSSFQLHHYFTRKPCVMLGESINKDSGDLGIPESAPSLGKLAPSLPLLIHP